MSRHTTVSIQGEDFHLNGRPTYAGRVWRGRRIEGLLLNSRMAQGVFDDLNPQTRGRWDYPAPRATAWDADRNTREFIEHMPQWRAHGLLSFTINLQGGSPFGYSDEQPWHNSAFTDAGELRAAYMDRLASILERADELGMAPIVGYFYFGQAGRLRDEAAVLTATDRATDWLLDRGYRNTLVEINNECDVRYTHPILQPGRVHELIERTQRRSDGRLRTPAGRLLVSASYGGGTVVKPNVARAADFILMHGNGVDDPDHLREMVRRARQVEGYRGQPILFNEDDHFGFDQPDHHMLAAIDEHAGWGYFDYRMGDEGYEAGYQSMPVDWSIGSHRKRAFFRLLGEVTGERPAAQVGATSRESLSSPA